MRQVRAALSFQTRRPKEMPATFPLVITKNSVDEKLEVTLGDHLIILPLPIYAEPAFIKPYDYARGIAITGIQTLRFGDQPEDLLKRHKAEKIALQTRLDHNLFARLLAKIAYSLAIAELGAERVGSAYVLPIIFGDMQQSGRWIGSSDNVLSAEPGDVQHASNVQIYRMPESQGSKSIIVVLLKLFANVPSPGYIVIVGELK